MNSPVILLPGDGTVTTYHGWVGLGLCREQSQRKQRVFQSFTNYLTDSPLHLLSSACDAASDQFGSDEFGENLG
ncbi:hypothetical protein L6164_013437 [Bauhinia variegata]|uniref:Uncharacterized protein n=1 Tax=Bauhinia variegata TaxID=167791 RepID=A0ACB9NF31_BAUVA|nr:hypothetical protein L6164_013437 [Bauhinia variegata]